VTNIQMGVIMFATGLALESFPERHVGLIGGVTGLAGGSVLWMLYGLTRFIKNHKAND
jgi:xanthine/uracil permease